MSEKYKIGDPLRPHFVTITIVDWVDLLTRPAYKNLIMDSLDYCIVNKGLTVHAYCIMPSHIHLIISSCKIPINEIPESRREWLLNKFAFAAKRIKRGINYKVWQDGFHPIELSNNAMMDQKLEYIHDNPVQEGYVYLPEQWLYSSAGFYINATESMIALQMLE